MFQYQQMANAIRFLSADAVQKAKSGHPGMPMGMADVATVLFSEFLKFNPKQPKWLDRDRFILSAGHGSMLLYSLFYLTGYEDCTIEEIKNFRQMHSKTAGHPEYGELAGTEMTTGPLGQGIATAVGMALAERMLNARLGDDLINHKTWVIVGDGCLMEGISQEAITLAGNLALSNLIVLWDDNDITIDGRVGVASCDDQKSRFKAAGWNVLSCDGHDVDSIRTALNDASKEQQKPTMVACRTVIGKGAPTKSDSHDVHGAPLGIEEIAAMREALNWSSPPFEVPENILDDWRKMGQRHNDTYANWKKKFDSSEHKSFIENASKFEGLDGIINQFKKEMSEKAPSLATRAASGKVLEELTKHYPQLIGGSADLTGSVNTKTSSTASVNKDNFQNSYIHWGVREHAMAAGMNGIALHGGLHPYSGTFAVFADYMRGAMRLSALMGAHVTYVLTHDSIGLGEDGPTHQPVETLATLRAMPNFYTFRPCDVVEAAECWQMALQHNKTPSALVLSRQAVPLLRTSHVDNVNISEKGAYLIKGTSHDRKVSILATGTEVHLAVQAAEQLEKEGIGAVVASVPCLEIFAKSDDKFKQKILGSGLRVVVEAAIRQPWDRFLRDDDVFIGMEGFGLSAPAEELYQYFGITVDNIVKSVKEKL